MKLIRFLGIISSCVTLIFIIGIIVRDIFNDNHLVRFRLIDCILFLTVYISAVIIIWFCVWPLTLDKTPTTSYRENDFILDSPSNSNDFMLQKKIKEFIPLKFWAFISSLIFIALGIFITLLNLKNLAISAEVWSEFRFWSLLAFNISLLTGGISTIALFVYIQSRKE